MGCAISRRLEVKWEQGAASRLKASWSFDVNVVIYIHEEAFSSHVVV